MYALDPATGAAALRSFTPGFAMSGADWDPHLNGVVFNQAPNQAFYWFDLLSPVPTFLGETVNAMDDAGMAWDEAAGLYWSFDASGEVTAYDPTTAFGVVYVGQIGRSVTAAEIADNRSDLRLAPASGSCPGPQSLLATGASPGGQVVFLVGAPGPASVPSGPCAGTEIGLQAVRTVRVATADAAGRATLSGTTRAAACGLRVQAVDLATCHVSPRIAP